MSSTGQRYRLSPKQVDEFFANGFVGPRPAFIEPEVLIDAAEYCEYVERARPPHPVYGRFSVRDFYLYNDTFRRLVTHPGFVAPLVQLLGESVLLWRTTSIVKPPRTGELGWHQDDGLYRGLEYGNDVPALAPDVPAALDPIDAVSPRWCWDINVWIALTDVTIPMGALRVVPGSQTRMVPVAQVPLPEAAFFDPAFATITDPKDFVRQAREGTLVVDVDTSGIFDGVDVNKLTIERARALALEKLSAMTGEITLPFEVERDRVIELPMKRGESLIFTERVLHSSGPNTTDRHRVGLSCRVTRGNTLVYPKRFDGQFMDGSNLNIKGHRCIRIHGEEFHADNNYLVEAPAERDNQ